MAVKYANPWVQVQAKFNPSQDIKIQMNPWEKLKCETNPFYNPFEDSNKKDKKK